MQIDPRRDGLDRRQIDVIVGEDMRLVGDRKCCPADTSVGIDVARRVRVFGECTRDAGPTLPALLLARRRGNIALLAARRRQRRVVRGLRRLAATRFQFRDAS
jgi:hypothetical protein